jgi:hypothetical protein
MQLLTRTRDFSVLQNVETGCGAHPTSYSVGTMVFPWCKAAVVLAKPSPSLSVKVKK